MPTGIPSKARTMIRAQALITKVQDAILKPEDFDIGQNELNAIKMLLAKCVPDLKAIEIAANVSASIVNRTVEFVDAPKQDTNGKPV